ncbi:MAG: NAD(P)H-dependent glycerol-3-phosphate dehydrogenase [Chlamydiota bacterium]
MKIACLGAGAWGFCLAYLLIEKAYDVKVWTGNLTLAELLQRGDKHPKLPSHSATKRPFMTTDLAEALTDVDLIVESVTSKGLRPVLQQVVATGKDVPALVITSKGIEQNSGLLLSEVAMDVFGADAKNRIGCLSGPSLADEVMRKLPTSVVCSAYDETMMLKLCKVFATPFFRVYPNADVKGVSFGGAMKNIIAIACAISDGLGMGENTKAALMTRGLHEMRKLGVAVGCSGETLSGLAGMGDLCATCLSTSSRNYLFGKFLAAGLSPEEAKEKVGMVVEGAYTCVSALQLGQKMGIPLPITAVVHAIIYEQLDPREAVESLLARAIKLEHL